MAAQTVAALSTATTPVAAAAPEPAGKGRQHDHRNPRCHWRKKRDHHHFDALWVVRWVESSKDSDPEEGETLQMRVIEVDV